VLLNFFFADLECVLLELQVLLYGFAVGLGSQTHQLFQGLDDLVILHLTVGHGNLAVLQTSGGFHDDGLIILHLNTAGVKIIDFSDFFKSDANDFGHNSSKLPYSPPQNAASAPARAVTEGF